MKVITPLTRKKLNIYSDFDKSLEINPISTDIVLNLDEKAISESIKHLVLTDKGERLFQPELGGNIRRFLFETNTPANLKLLKESIRDTITNYEPRAELINIEVTSNLDDNDVKINILYYARNNESPISLSFVLERNR